jgi:hypothetical protein
VRKREKERERERKREGEKEREGERERKRRREREREGERNENKKKKKSLTMEIISIFYLKWRISTKKYIKIKLEKNKWRKIEGLKSFSHVWELSLVFSGMCILP